MVFTIVTDETNEIALPFNTVSAPGRVVYLPVLRQCTVISNKFQPLHPTA
jgi:hypothetical protein